MLSTPAEVVGLVLPLAQEVVGLLLRLPKEAVGLVLSTEQQCCSETQGSAQQCCLLLRKVPELLSVLAAGPWPCRWGNVFLERSVTHQDKVRAQGRFDQIGAFSLTGPLSFKLRLQCCRDMHVYVHACIFYTKDGSNTYISIFLYVFIFYIKPSP